MTTSIYEYRKLMKCARSLIRLGEKISERMLPEEKLAKLDERLNRLERAGVDVGRRAEKERARLLKDIKIDKWIRENITSGQGAFFIIICFRCNQTNCICPTESKVQNQA